MSTGRIELAQDYKSEQKPVQPPPTRTIRFCLKCGRHDGLGGTLNRRHWWNGSLCNGESVVAKYALVSDEPTSERQRLRDAVVEAARAEYEVERTADRGANTITRTDALIKLQPLMQKRREAVAALVEFESLQQKEDKDRAR